MFELVVTWLALLMLVEEVGQIILKAIRLCLEARQARQPLVVCSSEKEQQVLEQISYVANNCVTPVRFTAEVLDALTKGGFETSAARKRILDW